MANVKDSVLHFSCDSCGTHLGVDDSLAGTEAPCPKCGVILKAPLIQEAKWGGSSGVMRGVSGGDGGSGDARSRESFASQSRDKGRRRERGSRSIHPNRGRMVDEDEKANFRVLIKILIATALVALLVSLVVWYLKNH